MKILNEKLLLEEEGFEDVETDDTQIANENDPETDNNDIIDNETIDDENGFSDENTMDISDDTNISTTYKVTYTLGSHENWSRVDTSSESEAEQIVTKYITNKWPDREFKIIETSEFDESELEETLNEALEDQITDAQPIETGAAVGMAAIISDLIKDEYEAIDGYNSAIATAEAEGFGDMVRVLTEIQAEENLHIGQLQTLMNMVDPNAHLVDDGQQEGIEQLANPNPTEIV